MMVNQKPERVLVLAAEGGGFDFFRQATADGRYRFTMTSMGCGFDRSDFDDEWTPPVEERSVPKTPTSFETLEEAITALLSDGMWVAWHPLEIHPDHRQAMWQFRQATIQAGGEDSWKPNAEQDHHWALACGL
jgi:hypothetical protein